MDGAVGGQRVESAATPELDDMAPVAFGRTPFRQYFEFAHRLPLGGHLLPKGAALFCFAIERLRYRGRPAHLTEEQDLDLKIATLIGHAQPVSNSDFPGCLSNLPVREYPAQFTRSFRQWTRLEKSRGPQPDVHPHAGHITLFCYKEGGLSGPSEWRLRLVHDLCP